MPESENPYCQCLYYSANALSRLITKMAEEEFATTGLTPSYAFIMMSLNKHEGLSPGELANIMMLTPSTITRLVEKLEVKGLAKRTFKGRNTIIQSTTKGKELNDIILKAWNNLFKRYSEVLGENEASRLTSALYASAEKLNKS